jgi:hypothetical protein
MKKFSVFLSLVFMITLITEVCAREKQPYLKFFDRNRTIRRRPQTRQLTRPTGGTTQEGLRALQAPALTPIGRAILIPVYPTTAPAVTNAILPIIVRAMRGEDLTPEEQQLLGRLIATGAAVIVAEEDTGPDEEEIEEQEDRDVLDD